MELAVEKVEMGAETAGVARGARLCALSRLLLLGHDL